MSEIVDIADLSVIYLSYDEPQKEEFWLKIKNMVPWATRIDGIKGSDNAHKAAADASSTERFVLIDGDNIPDYDFFNQQLNLDETNKNKVFRWRARNEINGLMYGNGGLSCWTKTFVQNMKTHENSTGEDETTVEFCFDPDYWAMYDCYSTTYPNGSEFQAWRAGFREGVKMCLDRGTRPDLQLFHQRAHQRNLDHLNIWHNIGRDVENGEWAIYGARLGTYMTMLTEWDYRQVQDFGQLEKIWKEHKPSYEDITLELKTRLDLPIVEFTSEQSKFFKHHCRAGFVNRGIMCRE